MFEGFGQRGQEDPKVLVDLGQSFGLHYGCDSGVNQIQPARATTAQDTTVTGHDTASDLVSIQRGTHQSDLAAIDDIYRPTSPPPRPVPPMFCSPALRPSPSNMVDLSSCKL